MTALRVRMTMFRWFMNRRFFCFLTVGGMIGALYVAVALLLVEALQIAVFWASFLSYCCMIPISFWAHKAITYQSKARVKSEFPRFCVTSGLGLLVSMATVKLFHDTLPLPSYLSVGAVLIVVPLLSYVLMTIWVFGTKRMRVTQNAKGTERSVQSRRA